MHVHVPARNYRHRTAFRHHIFGAEPDLVAIDLVDPVNSEAIGLVTSDRKPRSPMASALLAAVLLVDIEAMLAVARAKRG